MPPSAIADQPSPRTLDNLVEFENLIYARLFTEWARSVHPLTVDSISQLLSSRLLAQRPVDAAGLEWSDRKLRMKNRQLAELYRQFRDSSLAEVRLAMRDQGGSGLRQEICVAVAVRLACRDHAAGSGLESLPLATQLIAIASPATAIGLALDHLCALEDCGWDESRPITRSPARSLLVKVWGLAEAGLRQASWTCQRPGPTGLPADEDILALVSALQSYGEIAEQLMLALPTMCNAAIDWLRAEEAQLQPNPSHARFRKARTELLASALLCTEIALRQVALGLHALAPAFVPLAATAISATGISDLIAGLPSPTTHAGACYSRGQARIVLGSQLLAAAHDPAQIDSHRRELDRIARQLAHLPQERSSYREHAGLVHRLQVLRAMPDALGGSPGFTFSGRSADDGAARPRVD